MAQLSHSYMVTGKTIALTIRTFVYLDKSALSEYGFLLTSVWKLLTVFFCGGDMCISLSAGTISGEDLSGEDGPLVWTSHLRPGRLPRAALLSPGFSPSGLRVSVGNPTSPSFLAHCPQSQFHPRCVNELSPCCFSKLKSEICCI